MSQRQCLPIDDESIGESSDSEMEYDVTQISALKYLQKVRTERRKIPQIVTSSVPAEYEVVTSSIDVHTEKIPHEHDPTKEWQQLQCEKFLELREKIILMRSNPSVSDKIVEELPFDPSEEVECLKYCEENDPLLSVLLAMNQGHYEELTENLANYLSEKVEDAEFLEKVKQSSVSWITKWIYSLLACHCSVLDPEVHNSLRVIAKACIQITEFLKTLPESPDFLAFLPYNLITVIIAKNFHQFDLLSL